MPHAASLGRLWSLRQRLKCGEFDLGDQRPDLKFGAAPSQEVGYLSRPGISLFYLQTRTARQLLGAMAGFGKSLIKCRSRSLIFSIPLTFFRRIIRSSRATLYFKVNLFFWRRQSLMPLENFFGMRRVISFTSKLRPLTHGIAPRSIPAKARPMRERDIDLCFTGTIVPLKSPDDVNPFVDLTQNPIRQEIYERCEKLKNRYRVFCSHGLVPLEEYRELLQRSKLIVCTESFGCETFRHYGVSGAGAIPLINWPYAQNYNPLQPDVHAIYFSLIGDDFERTVARALCDPEKLDEIAQNARAFTLKHKMRADIGEMIIEETLREHSKRRV